MRRMIVAVLSVMFFLSGPADTARAQPFVAVVKSLEGGVTIKRDAQLVAASEGMLVMKGDVVATNQEGALGLVFSDDTLISMGPNSEVLVDDYAFEPMENRLSFVARIVRGTVSFLSGQIAKLSPQSVQLLMPVATIGVRGTHVLIKVDD